jgi:hypothetical protein
VKYIPPVLSIIQILLGFLVVLDAQSARENTGVEVMTEFYIGVAIIGLGALFLIAEILKRKRNSN